MRRNFEFGWIEQHSSIFKLCDEPLGNFDLRFWEAMTHQKLAC